ncbi:MAG TPA: DUF3307 domain-containing protein [Puia sp.]|nr:DUF3307 domain-containing protein [Puia sp.]
MIPGSVWLTKLLIAHLLTDFVFQPAGWIEERRRKHYASAKLGWHVSLTAVLAFLFIGRSYWPVALVIGVTHWLADVWKSYQPDQFRYFLTDQFLHLLVIAGCWWFSFPDHEALYAFCRQWSADTHHWVIVAAFLFVTQPSGVLIGQLTGRWSRKIDDDDRSLAHAGKWIGIAERIIVLILVLENQYSAIGLLITAKGIIRFSEKDRQEIKTEYLVIGTLLSIAVAIVTGLVVKGLS